MQILLLIHSTFANGEKSNNNIDQTTTFQCSSSTTNDPHHPTNLENNYKLPTQGPIVTSFPPKPSPLAHILPSVAGFQTWAKHLKEYETPIIIR